MSNIAISALPVATTQASADVLPIVQATTSTTKQLSIANLFTSATLVTPTLGVPASGTLTNCTGLPVATGVSGLGAGVATFLATPSSANLATAVTGETGSGALVFATSPTLVPPLLGTVTSGVISACTSTSMVMVTPVLGTPTSGVLTNCTGSPTFTDVKASGLLATTAAAATTQSTFISGVAAVVTITAPAPISAGGGTITLIPTGAFTWTAAGNIAVLGTAVVSRALTMTFDVTTTKWYPSYV